MKTEAVHPLKAMLGLTKPYKLQLLAVLLCLVVLSVFNLALPMVLRFVIDNVFKTKEGAASADPAERLGLLPYVLLAVFIVYGMRNLLFYMAKTRVMVVGERTAFELRQRLIRHLHALSVDFYQQNKPGKISARIMQDVQAIKQFVQDELANAMLNVLMFVVAAGIMFYMEWFLALVTLAILPFHVLVYYLFRKPIATYAREAKEQIADLGGSLIEQFDGAATVKASATQLLEQEKIRRSMHRGMRAQIKQSRYYVLQKVAADLLVGLGIIVLYGVGGYLVVRKGTLSSGDFVAFFLYVGLLYPRLLELVSQAGKFARTSSSVERVFEILHIEPSVRESPQSLPHEISQGRIEFRNVTFGYGNGNDDVLENVSFTIEPGEHVLVTGPSGAGKSTCTNLIPRFFDPQHGAILIDGKDVRDFTLTSLRRQIGLVFQDCFLFNDTIMANIRYAAPEASDQAVIEVARQAYADEFIERLPHGYLSIIGEGGTQLSQGEKRRLMIARAILKNPKILILDEPLVSLDPVARERTVDGLAELMKNRTVLTITHYPAELPYAHKQLHVSDGKVTVRDLSGRILAF